MFSAVDLGIADNGQRTSGEQASGSLCASTAITEPSHRQLRKHGYNGAVPQTAWIVLEKQCAGAE